MYPRLPSEGVLFRELFDSPGAIASNGGTLAGNTTVAAGEATFDGASGNVNYLPSPTIANIWSGGGSVEAWINASSDGEADSGVIYHKNMQFLHVQSEAGGLYRIRFFQTFSGDNGSWRTDVDIPIGSLVHFVMTYDSDSAANDPVFYVNGALVTVNEESTPTGTASTDDTDALYVGNSSADTLTFDGTIKELSFYNRVLTIPEVVDRFNGTTHTDIASPILDLPLETNYNNGSQVTDNKGSLGGTVQLGDGSTSSTYPTQLVPHGMNFDGSDDRLLISDVASIQDIWSGGGTFMAWIRADSDGEGDQARIFDKAGNLFLVKTEANNALELQFNHNFSGTNGSWDTSTQVVFLNQWTHLAVVYDSDDVANDPTFYLNGEPVSIVEIQTPVGVASSDAGNDLYIGNEVAFVRTFDGDIWDVKMFGVALTETQVDTLYRRGRRKLSV